MNGSLEGPDVLGQRQGMAGKVLVDHMSRVQGNDPTGCVHGLSDLTGSCEAPGRPSGAHRVGSTSVASVHRLEAQTTEIYLLPVLEAGGPGSRRGQVGSPEASLFGV